MKVTWTQHADVAAVQSLSFSNVSVELTNRQSMPALTTPDVQYSILAFFLF